MSRSSRWGKGIRRGLSGEEDEQVTKYNSFALYVPPRIIEGDPVVGPAARPTEPVDDKRDNCRSGKFQVL